MRKAVLALSTVVCLALVPMVGARADPGECDRTADPWCQVGGGTPPGGGGGGGGGGSGGCTFKGVAMPCTDPDLGSYIGDGCYWKRLDPVPAGMTPPAGKDPAKGAWGTRSCFAAPGDDNVTI